MSTIFTSNLAHPLEFGHALEIVGKTRDAAIIFQLDLCTGKTLINPKADIGLRLSCYFQNNTVHLNARIAEEWGIDEQEYDGILRNPIKNGEFFTIYIFCGEHKFHISVNNRPFCTFYYRMALEMLRTLEIGDQIRVIKQVNHRTIFPKPWPAPNMLNLCSQAFSNDIPILFSPGHVVILAGCFFGNPKGSGIIKFTDTDPRRHVIHFSVRFNEKAVVRNSVNKELVFGPEERDGGFPFILGQRFKMAIAFTESGICTAVNGKIFFNFAYRTPTVLLSLVGMKIACQNGLDMIANGVDHVQLSDPNCIGFENFSRLDLSTLVRFIKLQI